MGKQKGFFDSLLASVKPKKAVKRYLAGYEQLRFTINAHPPAARRDQAPLTTS